MQSATLHSLVIIAALFFAVWPNANAEVFKGFPDMIVCKPGKSANTPGELVFYIEGLDKKGTAYYKSIGRQVLAIKVGKDGVVTPETASVNDCLDQTLQQLRKQGRVFNFTR